MRSIDKRTQEEKQKYPFKKKVGIIPSWILCPYNVVMDEYFYNECVLVKNNLVEELESLLGGSFILTYTNCLLSLINADRFMEEVSSVDVSFTDLPLPCLDDGNVGKVFNCLTNLLQENKDVVLATGNNRLRRLLRRITTVPIIFHEDGELFFEGLHEKRKIVEEEAFSKNKKAKGVAADAASKTKTVEVIEENPNAVKNFRISEPLRTALKANGIEALDPIQARTFDFVYDGFDLIVKAEACQGKSLAFILPILESVINGPEEVGRRTGPTVLALLPSKESAMQVFTDFKYYGESVGLTACCLYGKREPIDPQIAQLERGVDIVVGAFGRVKNHIERGTLDLCLLRFLILDEADVMLRPGYVEDVKYILGEVPTEVQTVLFSATLPQWVNRIASKFLKQNKKIVDLVGVQVTKASESVRHIIMPCPWTARSQVIPDIIRHLSSGGRTIVFTENKDYCSELSGVLEGARPLHGDIQQSVREATLAGFRSGKFMTLISTNAAARGLDINDVQLIIQCEPPRDVEDYIHQSGRAGKTGVAITLYEPTQPWQANISKLEREAGVKFEHADYAEIVGGDAAEASSSCSVIPARRT